MRGGLVLVVLGFAFLGACAQPPPRYTGSKSPWWSCQATDGHVGGGHGRPLDGGEAVLVNKPMSRPAFAIPERYGHRPSTRRRE